ncbi:uncharacterized protein PITG_11942 [Phytophthora infestans T30-4]|uniref:Uncharacterized protein n=1 Tax=Phytophthora infestans (strain T30-4) TaxID=403677 RepID=D0NHK7_PHYIT|nr:uncharacterized protein PITG_11942 [Phytophthora infestans T30-4]EEY58932.1 conserved hypothetical protein [Phytophthora infestans T30-4]|eukprot:XP_002901405.1 conserved hypothetical protein [Phytophthora infestans T30-4]
MVSNFVKATALAVSVLATTTEAHNKMTVPVPTWPEGVYNQNSPSGIIDPSDVLPVPSGMSYTTDPGSNTKAYWTAFNASKYKSLKELSWDSQKLEGSASNECGFSLVDGTPRDLPDEVQWDFFTASHQGPCEVWCDDTLVFENWNCAVDYPETPANLPYDKAKCKGAAMLTSYWIALHTTPWQVYTNCAPLTGASSSSNTSQTATTPTVTSPTQTEASAEEEEAPSSDAEQEENSSTDDEASTDAEDDVTEAPPATAAPSVDKCSVRRRRH